MKAPWRNYANSDLFRPLPCSSLERLVGYYIGKEEGNGLSYPYYRDVRDRNEVFSGFIAFRFATANLSGGIGGRNEYLWGYLVSGNYFDTLGVRAAMGRTLTEADDKAPGAHPVVVLSHSCWQRRFGGDTAIVGKNVLLNGRGFTVIGVAPAGFFGTERLIAPEFFAPIMIQRQIEPGGDWLEDRGSGTLWAVGRLHCRFAWFSLYRLQLYLSYSAWVMTLLIKTLWVLYPALGT